MSKFIPEIPEDIRYESLSTRSLVIPEGFQLPETTEQLINRLLNHKLAAVNSDLDDEDDVNNFSLDDDDDGDFPEDFFDDELPFEAEIAPKDDSSPNQLDNLAPDVVSDEPSAGSSAEED
ncbi:hypothetical protein FNP13_08440 [Campylobacter jejuni]|nr:hypothetical protein [Campylobacter jejuni]